MSEYEYQKTANYAMSATDGEGESVWLFLLGILFGAFVLGFGPHNVVVFCRLYLACGIVVFLWRLAKQKENFYKELGCAIQIYSDSNILHTFARWPLELLYLIFGEGRSYEEDFRHFMFWKIKEECYGISNETVQNLVSETVKEIEKTTAAGFVSLARQIIKAVEIAFSGSMAMAIILVPCTKVYSQTASPKEITVQTEAWNDFYLERQLWLKLEMKKFLFWSQNRFALWPGKGKGSFSYLGQGFKFPVFEKSAMIFNFGPQISHLQAKIESFVLFTNFLFFEKGWKIFFGNRWQWVIESDKPLVRMHTQTVKTPWLSWLTLRTEENYGKGKWNWVQVGPEISFPVKILEYFRFYPNYDFVRKQMDFRTYFSYAYSF